VHFRNGDHGYGVITKALHWLTVTAIAAQFAVGLTMEADDEALDREKDRIKDLEDMGEERAERQGEAAEEQFENEIDRMEDALDVREDNYVADALVSGELSLPLIHVLLGVSIVVLGVVRVLWRTTTPLPPWAAHLGHGERRFEAWLEKSLLTLLFVVPATGLVLLTIGGDWLALHIAAQVALLAAIALHVGLVLKHTIAHRHRHLARML
jgi:cytochrome b561